MTSRCARRSSAPPRKLLWIWHELWVDGRLRATEEVLGVHVAGGSSAPFPDDIAAHARAVRVDPPQEASGRIHALAWP